MYARALFDKLLGFFITITIFDFCKKHSIQFLYLGIILKLWTFSFLFIVQHISSLLITNIFYSLVFLWTYIIFGFNLIADISHFVCPHLLHMDRTISLSKSFWNLCTFPLSLMSIIPTSIVWGIFEWCTYRSRKENSTFMLVLLLALVSLLKAEKKKRFLWLQSFYGQQLGENKKMITFFSFSFFAWTSVMTLSIWPGMWHAGQVKIKRHSLLLHLFLSFH